MRTWVLVVSSFWLALFLTGCTPAPSVPAETKSALAVFPQDTRMVGKVNVQALRTDAGLSFSAQRGFTMRLMDSDFSYNPLSDSARGRLADFIAQTGIDPETDIEAFYAAAGGSSNNPSDDSSDEENRYRFVVQANLEPEPLRQYLDENLGKAFARSAYQDVPVYTRSGADVEDPFHMAVVGNMVVAAPTHPGLAAMIDRALSPTNGEPLTLPLVAQSVPDEGFWVVVRDLPAGQLTQAAEGDGRSLRRIARVARDVSASMSFAAGRAHGRLYVTTDSDADDVASVVRGAVAGLRTGADLSDEERAVLESVEVTASDGAVTVDFRAEKALLVRTMVSMMRTRT